MVVKSESRQGLPIRLIAIHTNEGNHAVGSPDHTAENLAVYLDTANNSGDYKSYHLICDDDSTVRYVPDNQAAWSMPGGNLISLNLCFTGWAAWQREDWLAHKPMLVRGAVEVARWAKAFRIPVQHLTPRQVWDNAYGVIGHVDWTNSGPNRGNHTDPGANFPWPEFIALVNEQGEDMQPEEHDVLYSIHTQLAGPGKTWDFAGWPARPDDSDKPKTLVDYVRALHAQQQLQHTMLEAVIAKLGITP